ncbi:MAG: murein biosynthesis integral membrane protein MurJ [Planctomycetes bacterium]|nr:murein biosynthesis integral membrane protein MurJ [Planctomycetota bacterium]
MPTAGRLIASARLIALLTLASRALGLARECLFGYFFATSELLSAFRIAFMLPNLARRLFGEGALSAAMIPVLTESLERDGERSTRQFIGSLLTAQVAVLVVLVIAAEVVIAAWRHFQTDLALDLAALLMPYMGLICTTAMISGVLNVRGHFAAPACSPMILNTGVIVAALGGAFYADLHGADLLYAICGGVLVAGALQILIVGGTLRAIGFFPTRGGTWRDPRIRRVAILAGPMLLGISAVQINSLADHVIAYLFIVRDGQRMGPAVLGYAQFLYQLPLGVFGIAIATAIFPVLSLRIARNDRAGMADVLAQGIRLSLFVALPASVGLLFVAHPLVAALYQRGEFDAAATQRVAGTLFFYALGITAYFTQHLLARAFYSMHDSRTPARIALWMVGMNFLMNLALVFVLQERGLALATAVCAMIQVLLLSRRLTRALPQLAWGSIARSVAKMLLATSIMAGVLAALMVPDVTARWLEDSPVLRLALLVFAGVASYGLASRALSTEELTTLLHRERSQAD